MAEVPYRRTLAGQTCAIAVWSLAIACLVFVLFPRTDHEIEAFDSEAFRDDGRSVGFSEDVTLGEETGEATLNADMVMRVQLFEEPGGLPIQLDGEPLFRGAVATSYSHGKWRQKRSPATRPLEPVRLEHYIRQHIIIEKQDDTRLFSMMPAFLVKNDDRLRLDNSGDEIVRSPSARSQRMEFDLATVGGDQRRQIKILPCYRRVRDPRGELLQMPAGGFGDSEPLAGLCAAAARIKAQERLDDDDRIGLARALERYLRDSGEFQYTLEGQKRNAELDPLEDFIVEHRQGHCEYFAGALALMLRSQGIPARIAIGFRAGEWNSDGGYYQVRQLHAHTWVEALLEPKHYAEENLGSTMRWAVGGWLVLDPTPIGGSGAVDEASNRGLWHRASMYLDYWQVLWNRYVGALDAEWQQKAIYRPLRRFFSSLLGDIFKFDTLGGWLRSAARTIAWPWQWYRRNFFSWQGALSTLLLLAAAGGVYRSAGPIARWWQARPRRPRVRLAVARKSQNDMYCRLERALARRGLVRLAGQTPFEFAQFAGGDLTESAEHVPLAALPRRVVEAFYRIRFGARLLEHSEANAVEQALRTLEEKL